MAKIDRLSQIDTVVMRIIADCMNEVAERAVKLLQKHVVKDVYTVGDRKDRAYYYKGDAKPTYQLHDSVVHSKAEIKGLEVESKVFHDKDKMEFDPGTYLHGSNYFSPNDVREMLPYIIDQGKSGGMFGDKWKNLMRPYMSNTRADLDDGLVADWMTEALNKRGIKVMRVSTF